MKVQRKGVCLGEQCSAYGTAGPSGAPGCGEAWAQPAGSSLCGLGRGRPGAWAWRGRGGEVPSSPFPWRSARGAPCTAGLGSAGGVCTRADGSVFQTQVRYEERLHHLVPGAQRKLPHGACLRGWEGSPSPPRGPLRSSVVFP